MSLGAIIPCHHHHRHRHTRSSFGPRSPKMTNYGNKSYGGKGGKDAFMTKGDK